MSTPIRDELRWARWTAEDVEKLRAAVVDKEATVSIARVLGRTQGAASQTMTPSGIRRRV
jgi:hypothetical protein